MTNVHGTTATWKAKQLKLKYKEDFKKMVRDKWKEKAMHGKFPNYLDKDHVDVADQYLNRNNQVAAQLHLDICRHSGIKVEAECWYQHKPE